MKIIHLKDSKQITFLDERFYLNEKSKKYHPSNTTILSVYPKGFGFDQWLKDYGNNADFVLKRAQDQGNAVHNAIDLLNKGKRLDWVDGETDNYTLQEWLMILKYGEFMKETKAEIVASEVSLVSDELEFGSTLDLICKINEEYWYIDHKTGKSIFKNNKIQLAAGMMLWNSLRKGKITRIGCLHLQAKTRGPDKKGLKIQGKGWQVVEATDPDRLFSLFKHAQVLWKEENPNMKPKNLVYSDTIKL